MLLFMDDSWPLCRFVFHKMFLVCFKSRNKTWQPDLEKLIALKGPQWSWQSISRCRRDTEGQISTKRQSKQAQKPKENIMYQKANRSVNILLCGIYAAHQHWRFGLSFRTLWFLLVFVPVCFVFWCLFAPRV